MNSRLLSALWGGAALLALAVLVPEFAQAGPEDRMQGTWKVVSAKVGSKEATAAELKEMEVIVEGDKFTLVEGSRKYTVHFDADAKAKPHRVIEFFKSTAKQDKLWHGIYDFDGMKLTLCWGPAGEERPKAFDTKNRNQNRLYVLRKNK